MVFEQKKLKRQSQILMQSSSPSQTLQEALSQVARLTQDLETQTLEHQGQVCVHSLCANLTCRMGLFDSWLVNGLYKMPCSNCPPKKVLCAWIAFSSAILRAETPQTKFKVFHFLFVWKSESDMSCCYSRSQSCALVTDYWHFVGGQTSPEDIETMVILNCAGGQREAPVYLRIKSESYNNNKIFKK